MRPVLIALIILDALCAFSFSQDSMFSSSWVEEQSGSYVGGRRHAVLIGVGRHESRPAWDLPFIENDLLAVEEVLRESLRFHQVEVIRDTEVSTARVHRAIERAREDFVGEGNLLLIYWAGHGWVNTKNELRFLTSYSRYSQSSGYRFTIGEGEVAQMLAPMAASDSGTTVVSIFDCCRIKTMGPTGRTPKEVNAGHARIYSARPGSFAFPTADQSRSRFSEAFESSARDLAKDAVLHLGDWFDTIKNRMGSEQTPQLKGRSDAREIRVYDRGSLSLGIEVIDGLSGRPIKNAVIKIADREVESPALIGGLTEGDYRLDVRMPGYMRALISEIKLDDRTSGRKYRVAIKPAYSVINGVVADSAGIPVEGAVVRLNGSRGRHREGYHRFEDRTDPQGAFSFMVPKDAALSALTVRAGDFPLQTRELDLDAMKPREDYREGALIQTFSLGSLLLPPEWIIPGALGLDGFYLTAWEQAEAFLAQGDREDLDIAISYYKEIQARVEEAHRPTVSKRIRASYVQMLSHLMSSGQYKVGQRRAQEALKDFPGDKELLVRLKDFEREDIPSDLRSKMDRASQLLESNQDHDAEKIYRHLVTQKARLTPFYADQVQTLRKNLAEKLFHDAFVQINTTFRAGQISDAASHYHAAVDLIPQHPFLSPWKSRFIRFPARFPRDGAKMVKGFTYLGRNIDTNRDEYRHIASGLEFVFVPAQTFSMGSPKSERGRGKDETQHQVKLSDYLIAKYEVTIGDFRKFTKKAKYQTYAERGEGGNVFTDKWELRPGARWESPYAESPLGEKYPATQLTWSDALKFCEHYGLNLPTEAQWECAGRAGATTAFAFGKDGSLLSRYGNFCDRSSSSGWSWRDDVQDDGADRLAEVGTYLPNQWGLFDMQGNVMEWCADWYAEFTPKDMNDPKGPVSGTKRVLRGGSWNNERALCRSASRLAWGGHSRSESVGFRPALSLGSSKS